MANPYVDIYGPVADSAAAKYGLNPQVFRRLIMSESSFDPYAYNPKSVGGENASGIAQFLPSTAASRGVDPFDPFSALDGAAKYLKELSDKFGLAKGIAKYKGYSEANMENGLTTAATIIGDSGDSSSNESPPYRVSIDGVGSTGDAPGGNADTTSDKPLWRYGFSDLKNAITGSALGLVIGFVGLLIIIFAVYAIFAKAQPIKVFSK